MTLKEVCQANPDGFTLDLETGKMATHKSGYYVSLTNYSDSKPNFDAIVKAYSLFSKACGRKCYIGGWKDGDKYYIDITVHVTEYEPAMILKNLFGQKAIYDCKAQKSIEFYL